jgi:pantoate--beta-alanine ligase
VAGSIFVNPTQFGPGEDFGKYPRTLQADTEMFNAAGCDLLFVPSAAEMYGEQFLRTGKAAMAVDPGALAQVLEGAIRPGHFAGVCTVVLKLLNIVQPTELLLGQKDFQQQAILRRMCAELNVPVEVVTCPTVREADGLAMSSRNRYLNPDERSRAVAIYDGLMMAKRLFEMGERNAAALESAIREKIEQRGLTPQYAVAANPSSLELWSQIGPAGKIEGPCVFLVAAKLGTTRLIDNWLMAAD